VRVVLSAKRDLTGDRWLITARGGRCAATVPEKAKWQFTTRAAAAAASEGVQWKTAVEGKGENTLNDRPRAPPRQNSTGRRRAHVHSPPHTRIYIYTSIFQYTETIANNSEMYCRGSGGRVQRSVRMWKVNGIVGFRNRHVSVLLSEGTGYFRTNPRGWWIRNFVWIPLRQRARDYYSSSWRVWD